jgi:predicted regulator of Ras-like GTPase activity (Roadblock/LC7/MglB family)
VEVIDDTLLECRGLLYAHGALYANANNSKAFVRLRDTDGDGKFDETKELLRTEGRVGHGRNHAVLEKLLRESNSKVIFLVDKNGQLISSVGETEHLDTTSLASLTAGNIAATGGLAKLIGEKEFSILFHEGEKDNIHISIIAGRVILVVIFDQRSSLGLVRLRVKKAGDELARIFEDLAKKTEELERSGNAQSPFAEITDDDIDNLFK